MGHAYHRLQMSVLYYNKLDCPMLKERCISLKIRSKLIGQIDEKLTVGSYARVIGNQAHQFKQRLNNENSTLVIIPLSKPNQRKNIRFARSSFLFLYGGYLVAPRQEINVGRELESMITAKHTTLSKFINVRLRSSTRTTDNEHILFRHPTNGAWPQPIEKSFPSTWRLGCTRIRTSASTYNAGPETPVD
ncbi:hypothetical protein TNCV_1125341 [Trichonephila clavipes]|nr:hypothetical protein TNCV_1125341 [Trichonephila clavipes]